jgi:CRP/FNR family transcriptional regulator, cyclic AMP receptor protein
MPKRERDALAHVPLFEGLSPRHLKRLADLTQDERLMTGATIVKAGEPGDTFYVILEGEAKVVNASNRVVNRLQPGDSFGEISLLDGGPRTATVIAETPMRVATLERKGFLRTLEAEPAVAVKLLGDAARLLRRLTRPTAG